MAALALALAACGSPTVPDEAATYSGEIIEVHVASETPSPGTGPLAIVWIKESDDDPCGIRFSIHRDTEVIVQGSRATVADLRVGRTADVWFEGTVLTSCPAQAGADLIRVR